MSIRMNLISTLLFLLSLLSSKACISQKNCREEDVVGLRIFIEKKFQFLDTCRTSQRDDFAILRISRSEGKLMVEYMTFPGSFENSLSALRDSIVSSWHPKSAQFNDIYIPLRFVFNDEQPDMHRNVSKAFELFTILKHQCFSCIWIRPIYLMKFDRVS
jgi:hypothetical protein